jgi:hypothetical protein
MRNMGYFLRKAFGIYTGEAAHAFRFARLAVFWAFGSSCLETLSDSLFLEKIGAESLPFVYLSIAIGMMGISSLVLYSLKLTSPYRILTVALSVGALICIAASFFVGGSPPPLFWYGLKIASRMFFVVMVAVSWTFTDQYHDLQDAKRVYSIYSAAYFFGTILAGTAINLCLELVGFSGLLIGSALFIGAAMWQARQIAFKSKAVHDDSTEGIFSGSRDSFSSVIRLIVRSKFAIFLLLLSLFVQLMLMVTEFNYLDSFDKAFKHLPELSGEMEIAAFLGKWRAIISCCNIIVGCFLYGRFVRRAGLSNALLVTPLFFLGVYGGWVFSDGLMFALLGLIACDGVLWTVEDNCFNLLSNAVPTKLKSKVRIINDSFFEPIGTLLSAFLLLGLQSGSHWLGLALSLIVLVLALTIRSFYSQAILTNLKDNGLHFDRKLKDWLKVMTKQEVRESKKDILSSLNSPSEEIRLLSIDALLELGEPSDLSKILQVAKTLGTHGKIQLLKLFETSQFSKAARLIEAIEQWIEESGSPELAKWGNLYLAKRGLFHTEIAEETIDALDPFAKGAAILTLKTASDTSLEYGGLNRTIAEKKLDLMLKSTRIDEVSIALDVLAEDMRPASAEMAFPFLSHEALVIKRAASRCIAKLAGKHLSRYAPRLIEELENAKDNIFRLHLLDALGKSIDSSMVKELLLTSVQFRPNERRKTEMMVAQMGLKIVPLLLSLTKDPALPERARILAGKILAKLALPQLQANLIDILDIEIERAYFYFYFGHTIQNQYPLYDLEMLQNALLSGYQSVIDFIIHLLGAAGALEDPGLLSRALQSRNEKIHSHAVESLEKTCDSRIFRLIAPLIDDLPLEEKMSACLKWQGNYPQLSLGELCAKLEESPSLFDKIVAVRLKAKLQMPNWKQELREQMKRSDETFHQYAYELLEL